MKSSFSLIILFLLSSCLMIAAKQSLELELRNCLLNIYHIDQDAITNIICKFNPIINIIPFIINEFIEKSSKLNIQSSSSNLVNSASLMHDDSVIKAPEFHAVIFENSWIRILETVVKPGQREPFHRHYWKSFMIIVSGANFIIDYADGTQEESSWPEGFYELPADEQSASYLNKGYSEFRALRFEFKE